MLMHHISRLLQRGPDHAERRMRSHPGGTEGFIIICLRTEKVKAGYVRKQPNLPRCPITSENIKRSRKDAKTQRKDFSKFFLRFVY
jgi:hypothetical protein